MKWYLNSKRKEKKIKKNTLQTRTKNLEMFHFLKKVCTWHVKLCHAGRKLNDWTPGRAKSLRNTGYTRKRGLFHKKQTFFENEFNGGA